ncbi:MAG: hypothetical protein HFI29_08860 [Lachnospiraceae bacterium]|jgi:hypothetical protein|nr:hypothetical protein [Lachnospiraceae bacterium]
MKRIILAACTLLILTFFLTACGSQKPQDIVSEELGIDASDGSKISYFDNHGGFHGDGTAYIALSFADHTVLDQIETSTPWKSFPLNETVKTLVYGISDKTSRIGPFLNDGNGNSLVPEIKNGYYLLIDRHTDKSTDILTRSSFHFTLGLYDTDTDTLYYCELDT